MPRIPDKCRLLHGPYRPPRLHVGDRAFCHLRGTVVITSWTAARICWPRCIAVGTKGGVGVLLDDELVRAVRTEAAAAVCYWWGVTQGVVVRWRKALRVTRTNNRRTHQLMLEACQAGAEAVKAKEWTEEELQAKRETAERLDLARHLRPGYHGEWWSAAELRLLGKFPDEEVARRTGRTVEAARVKREKLGITNPASPHWTDDELALLGTMPDLEVAERTGRTAWAVYQKRYALGIPPARGTGRKRCGGAAS